MNSGDLINLILGGGLVGTAAAGIKAFQSWRAGARTHRQETLEDLERWRQHADDARQRAEADRDYWRTWAGLLEYACLTNGIPLPPRPVHHYENEKGD